MAEIEIQRAVLLADITGSTPLYEAVGDSEAAQRIFRCIDRMRDLIGVAGGVFVAAKGDDVLATFEGADPALLAVGSILEEVPMNGLSIHAGLHFGTIVSTRGDIFGDAVNLTARLAAMANPGEVLISCDFAAQLSPGHRASLRRLNAMTFKGKSSPLEVFTLSGDTRMLSTPQSGEMRGVKKVSVRLRFGEKQWVLEEGASLSVGRAVENELVVFKPWVSRRHATIAVMGNRVQFTDSSSFGSYLTIADAAELIARRETIVLVGSGCLSPGTSANDPGAAVIAFEVRTSPN